MPDRDAVAALAIPLIKKFEGCRLHAYPDPASGAEPWTIGYGATGPDIRADTVWTQQQADDDLARRVAVLVTEVCDALTIPLTVPLSDASCSALVSFAYNCGIYALRSSTLLHRISGGDALAASYEFAHWVHAAGKVNHGLVKRRAEERAVFIAGLYPQPTETTQS